MQTRIDEPAKRARYHFDSLYELAEWVKCTPRTWSSHQSVENSADKSWDLGAGYSAAFDMARDGWMEGADQVQEALKVFNPATTAPDTKTDIYGFRPHVPRFCAGAPDSMVRHCPKADSGSGKVLTLVVPVTIPCMVRAEYASNFGVAVAQYVNQMEANGTRIELHAGIFNVWDVNEIDKARGTSWRECHTWNVKHADQPLDLAVVAFAIGHPAMWRRLGFALLERSVAPRHRVYSYSTRAQYSDLINPAPGTFILNGMKDANIHAKTPEAALKYITLEIEKAIAEQEL